MGETLCVVHADEVARAQCTSCGVPMCGECWEHDVDHRPWCEGCVALLAQPTPASLYVAAAVMASVLSGLLIRKIPIEPQPRWLLWGVLSLAFGISAYKVHGRSEVARAKRLPRPRDRSADGPSAAAIVASPYRGRLRRIVRRVSPPISGSMAALLVAMTMGFAAGVIPNVLALPRWIEWQLVFAAWLVMWTSTFSVLLYRGWRVASDVPDVGSSLERATKRKRKGGSKWWGALDVPTGCADVEGCAGAVVFLLALAAAFALAWALVELVLPLMFAAAYYFIMRGLARVANDHHECEGHIVRSVAWGFGWATLYTAPLALAVWLGHLLLR